MENKYDRIVDSIKGMIRSGELKPGCKTPSIREICNKFSCNKATAIRAYEELQKVHLLYSVPKSGFYVVENTIPISNKIDSLIDFSSASPASELLPYQDFQHSINQAINIYKEDMFNYSDTQGLPGLRKAVKNHLRDNHIFTRTENIFITSGTQQALYILSKISFPNGKRNVLIEQPTYYGMMKALEFNNVNALGIARGEDGFDMEELERFFRNSDIKFFYIIPRFHNPTGFSLSNEQKKHILRLAKKYDIYIVEDDYLADLELDSKADSMYSLDTSGRVVYIKSYSKTLLPGLRLGVTVVPPTLVSVFHKHKVCCDFITNTISQGALEIYLKSGMYESHVKKIKRFYHEQMNSLRTVCGKAFSNPYRAHVPETGFFACLELPQTIRAIELEKVLELKNIRVTSADMLYLPDFIKRNIIRISVCKVNKQQITKGIEEISKGIKNEFNNSTESIRFTNRSFF